MTFVTPPTQIPSENLDVYRGIGSPEGGVTAKLGAIYINESGGAGTTMYLKEADDDQATGWAGV